MAINRFEELECWAISRDLMNKVYGITHQGQFKRDFGLRNQIERASVSVMTNIAEGFDSRSDKAFNYFLTISFRSATEIQSLLYVALDQHYISKNDFDKIYGQTQLTKKLIGGLSRYLNKCDNM